MPNSNNWLTPTIILTIAGLIGSSVYTLHIKPLEERNVALERRVQDLDSGAFVEREKILKSQLTDAVKAANEWKALYEQQSETCSKNLQSWKTYSDDQQNKIAQLTRRVNLIERIDGLSKSKSQVELLQNRAYSNDDAGAVGIYQTRIKDYQDQIISLQGQLVCDVKK